MLRKMGQPGLVCALACLALSGGALPSMAQERSLAWNYNSFGIPGLIDMPTAFGREDAELGLSVSHFRNHTRNALTFQISKRLSASFRYSLLHEIRASPIAGAHVYPFIFDRSFSVQYRLMDEGRYRPAVAIGLNDLVGTGIYGGEYLVASKSVTPRLRATIGLGWGRLGSYGGFRNPLGIFGDSYLTRSLDRGPQGGTFEPGAWFKGDAAVFGGVEWQVNDKLTLTAEYSSDDYAREDGTTFQHKSPLNFGLTYQYSDRTALSARYLYGSELGVQVSYALNPKKARHGSGMEGAPPPVLRRDALRVPVDAGTGLAQALSKALAQEGLGLDGMERTQNSLRIQIRNDRYGGTAQAVGRAARVLTRLAPADMDTFVIRLAANGMPVTSVVLRRGDIEDLEFHPVGTDLLRAQTRVLDAPDSLPPLEGRYPLLSYGVEPYLTPSLFDPDDPLRIDFGAALVGRYEPRPGLVFSGRIHQKLLGNLDNSTRASTSVLPRVRSEAYLYAKNDGPTIPELTMAYYFRPGEDLFGRVTLGYLEPMFGGVSTEVLWKRPQSRLALGLEMNYVQQRDFDQLFGFQPYRVATGHISAYYDLGRGYQGQLDVGRYLAGDTGATLSLSREFANGWSVGAFATVTNVSAADFGEGSFDKGIQISLPMDWITGRSSKTRISKTVRPVQRDGGARLNVSGRLYETVRGLQSSKLDATWGRFWR